MDAWGHATIIHEGNGATLTRGYSQVTGLMTSLTAGGGSATLAQYLYAWDGFGNLATRTDGLSGVTETEGYDDLNRLVSAAIAGGASRTYAYDATGNRTQACLNGSCISYSYAAGPAGPHALTSSSAGGSYSYNANGQMTNNDGQTLTWSAFGKAKTITQGATHLTLSYGPGGARIHKSVHYQSATRTTTETVTYLQGAKRLSVDGVTSIRRTITLAGVSAIDTGGADAKLLYVIRDHLGSTVVLGDDAGGSAQAMSYSPFGRRMTTTHWQGAMSTEEAFGINTSLTDKGYTGQEGLDAVGLWDYNARLYDPALGRFLSVDPLIAHPGSTQAINPYSYVENNPLNKTDPTGMASVCSMGMDACAHFQGSGQGIGGIDWNVTQNKDGSLAVSPSNGPGNIQEVSSVTIGVVTVPTGAGQGAKPASMGFDENTHSGKAGKVASNTSAPMGTESASNESSKATFSRIREYASTATALGGTAMSLKEWSLSSSDMWKGANGKWYNKSWGGNKATGGRTKVLKAAKLWKYAGRGVFVLDAGMGTIVYARSMEKGNYLKASKTALDVGMAALGTFAGPIGLAIALIYFAIDMTVGWPAILESYDKLVIKNQEIMPGWNAYGYGPK